MTITNALKSMGYRRMPKPDKQVWGKPVGNSLFTIELKDDTALFTTWFKGAQDKILIWDSSKYVFPNTNHGASLLAWLKDVETWTRIANHHSAQFEFLSLEEVVEDAL